MITDGELHDKQHIPVNGVLIHNRFHQWWKVTVASTLSPVLYLTLTLHLYDLYKC